jgi:myo-inositol-1(or 4)-monophosphatase
MLSDISIRDGLIATGFPFRKKDFIEKYLELFKRVFDKVSDIRRAGSAALDLAYIACGRCDGFFEIGLSPWDIAAGSLLIKEVGGNVTDFDGGQDYFTTGNIVAGVPGIHSDLMKDVNYVFGEGLNQ